MKFAPQLKIIKHDRLIKYLNGEYVNPVNIEISPSGRCQANCPWCFYKDEKNMDMIDPVVLLDAIKQFKEMEVHAVTWTGGGEPTMHPNFKLFVDTLYSLDIKQGLFTNGIKCDYDPSKFEWIRISYTNKGWPNDERFNSLRKARSLGMCINYTGNDGLIIGSLALAEEMGVDYLQVRPALKSKGEKVKYKIPDIQHPLLKYTDYKFSDSNKSKRYTSCEGFHFVPYINEKGLVKACPYMGDHNYYTLGNLTAQNNFYFKQKDFKTIMQDAERVKTVCDKCQICCKLHEVNELIYNLRKIEDGDFV